MIFITCAEAGFRYLLRIGVYRSVCAGGTEADVPSPIVSLRVFFFSHFFFLFCSCEEGVTNVYGKDKPEEQEDGIRRKAMGTCKRRFPNT